MREMHPLGLIRMLRARSRFPTLCAAAVAMLALPAQAAESGGAWRHSFALYGMGVAIDGDARIGPVEVPVDLSISDVFDALEWGAMAAYRVENDTWSFTGDVTYMKLAFDESAQTQLGPVSASLDADQLTVMATAGYRLSPNLELLGSLAYFDLSSDLAVRAAGQRVARSGGADWVDPLVGLHYQAPVGGKWTVSLRGDVGGFGIGSDLTLHGWATLRNQVSDAFSWFFGYRYIAYDYSTGSGLNREVYDLQQHGPGIGVAYSF